MSKQSRWGTADDAKLLQLFRTPHNGVDPTKLDVDSVKAVYSKYFGEKKYANFAPLYRGKARQFNVSRTLDGHRKRSATRKAAEAGKVNLEDISDDDEDPYDYSEGDDEDDLESESDDEEDEEEVEEDDIEMSTSAKKKRATSRKTPKTPTKNDESVDDVTQSINKMSVEESVPKFSMDFSLPFIMKIFKEDNDEMVGIDVYVPTLPKDYFIPDIDAQGRVFVLGIRVPNFFKDEDCVLAVNEGGQFNRNTYEAQAYKERCEEIEEHYGFAASIFGNPIQIKLPFQVEQRIVHWEIQGHENDLDTLTDDLGGQQFHFTLSAKLMKLKSKRRTTGGFRIIGGAANAMNDDL